MKDDSTFVMGHRAPAPRLTHAGAALMALAIAVPAGLIVGLVAGLF